MDKYKVSFIVPVYNVEKYIKQCLESLVNQSIDNKEVIIINDGSTDSSINIIELYSKKYEYIHVINQKNKGLSEARNTGMKHASGKYIQFIDSDDYVDVDYAEEFYSICEKYDLDILRGQYKKYLEEFNQLMELKPQKNIVNRVMLSRDYFIHCIENKTYEVTAILGFFKREFLIQNRIKFVPNVTMEDHDFTLKCLTLDEESKCMEIMKPFYTYRIRPKSITTTYEIKNIEDIIINVKKMIKYVEENNFNNELKVNCYKAISTLYYHATSVYGRLNAHDRKFARGLFEKELILFSARYAYTKHQRIKFILSYFFWPILDGVYNLKRKSIK